MSHATRRAAQHLAKVCEEQGFRVKRTKSGFVTYAQDPEGPTVGWHTTPSDWRWLRNTTAELRKIGVRL